MVRKAVGYTALAMGVENAVATALQELMDERDKYQACWSEEKQVANELEDHWNAAVKRAEKAEAARVRFVMLAACSQSRAEAAEALAELRLNTIEEYARASATNAIKLDLANRKLAELVRRVREWQDYWQDMRQLGNAPSNALEALLADYEPKTEEKEKGDG